MMQRIWMVAVRDFTTTVSNKGFLLGLLVVPILIAVFLILGPRILNGPRPVVVGQLEVIDPTGGVLPALRVSLDPATIAARRAKASGPSVPGMVNAPIPELSVVERPSTADLQSEKRWLIQPPGAAERHLALIVVHPDAVTRPAGQADYGSYDLYVASRLDQNTESVITEGLRQALVSTRLKLAGIDQAAVEAAMRVAQPTSVTVAAGGEHETRPLFTFLLPFACGILLFIGIMTGGQILITSTVAEKSNRVIEVLLAAVSPIELMWGKLLGQLAVGLLIMVAYAGLGLLALVQYALIGLIDPMLLVYLVVFYLLAYLVYGALMMAVGAAVSQAADAQSLMGPIMILLVAPYALVPMIGQNPSSTLSVVMSFVPPINSFAILARLASGSPPPAWQIAGSLAAGVAAACIAVWFAAKVFKIALLMHGKPPSLGTLVRWARSA